jgi:hypothetical protein
MVMMTGDEETSTYKELRRVAESLTDPISFVHLIANGVLRERGAWYEVLDVTRLPEHARVKISALRAPNLVKFRKPSKKMQNRLRRGY